VFLVESSGDGLRSISAELDVDFHDASIADWAAMQILAPVWLDHTALALVASVHGNVRIARLEIKAGQLDYLTPDSGRAGSPCPLPDGGMIFAANSFIDPGELNRLSPDGRVEAITSFNADWRAQVELAVPEPLSATSQDGEQISGWLLRPTGPVDERGAPVLLEIHGGPFGMYADTMMHEFHMLAARGYAIVFCNPRGSAGYGDRFAGLLTPEMGENDLPDLMAIVDAALALDGLDETRMGVLGGSYGGFMTNWIVAHSDRFRAAVTMRSICDWYSTWGTDDIFFGECNVTFGATPWENPEIYFRLSPIAYVEQMTAPLLIIHSEEDYRCPIGQAEQLFTSLKRLGRTTELVRFPDESHGLSRTGQPRHRVERLEHIVRWFESHL
jgi:dipeptidyl aminopeptidase/acylaminoacyl peptidase